MARTVRDEASPREVNGEIRSALRAMIVQGTLRENLLNPLAHPFRVEPVQEGLWATHRVLPLYSVTQCDAVIRAIGRAYGRRAANPEIRRLERGYAVRFALTVEVEDEPPREGHAAEDCAADINDLFEAWERLCPAEINGIRLPRCVRRPEANRAGKPRQDTPAMTVQEIYERCDLSDLDEYRGMPGAGIGIHGLTPWTARRAGVTHEFLRVPPRHVESLISRVRERIPELVHVSTANSRKWPGTCTVRFRLNPAQRQDNVPKKAKTIGRADYIAAYQADTRDRLAGKLAELSGLADMKKAAGNQNRNIAAGFAYNALLVEMTEELERQHYSRTGYGFVKPETLASGMFDPDKLRRLMPDFTAESFLLDDFATARCEKKDLARIVDMARKCQDARLRDPDLTGCLAGADPDQMRRLARQMNAKIKDAAKRQRRRAACEELGLLYLAKEFA